MSENIVVAAMRGLIDDFAATASDPGSVVVPGYVLVRAMLGGSGAGTYLARRDSDGKLTVVKLHYPGDAGTASRDAEYEILERTAKLGHVVRAIEKGEKAITPIGECPYLVEEFIDGVPVDEYVRQKKLNFRERLALFGEVCEAVKGCHIQGTAHLDLKPGHVLVVEIQNGEAGQRVIYLIDFGISRREEGAFLGASRCTRQYAAPEQLDGSARVDTRADIFALGVMLKVLLEDGTVAQWPSHRAWRGMVRLIGAFVPGPEPIHSAVLASQLRSVLDKARQPVASRYQQMADFAGDIENLAVFLPVTAASAPRSLRLGLFARREPRLAVALGALACLAAGLITTLTVLLWDQNRLRIAGVETHSARLAADAAELRREREARGLVEIEAERGDRAVTLLTSLLAPGEGITGTAPDQVKTQLRAIEERGLALAATDVDKARVLWTMGQIWTRYGNTTQALGKLEQAGSLMVPILGPNAREVLFVQADSVPALLGELDFERAKALGERTVTSLETVVLATHYRLAQCRLNLAAVLVKLHDLDGAEVQLAKVPDGDPDAPWLGAYASCIRGSILEERGQLDEAARLNRPAVTRLTTYLGPTHPYTLFAKNNLGSVLAQLAGIQRGPVLDEAIRTLEEVVADRRTVLGAGHPSTVLSEINLAAAWSNRVVSLRGTDSSAQASLPELLRQAVELLNGVVARIDADRDHLIGELPRALAALAMFLLWDKQADLAEAAAARAVDLESQCLQSGRACPPSNARQVLEFVQHHRQQ